MTAWSAEIANEFIRRAAAEKRALTQMQLQKLVYIAHGWNLAINGEKLTHDDPQAWDYGPVYRDLWEALDAEVNRHKTTWTWTKGHASHEDNNRADELATMAISKQVAGSRARQA